MNGPKTVALYLRVSTGEQTVENQRQVLEAACARHGWQIVSDRFDIPTAGPHHKMLWCPTSALK